MTLLPYGIVVELDITYLYDILDADYHSTGFQQFKKFYMGSDLSTATHTFQEGI
jgi:hypothetical protein